MPDTIPAHHGGEERPYERETQTLLDFARAVATATTTQEVLDAVCTHGPKALGVTGCAAFLLEGDLQTGTLVPRAVAGGSAAQRAQVLGSRLLLSEPGSVAAQVLRSGEPAIFNDAEAGSHHPLVRALGLRSMLEVPLRTPEGPLGLLVLADTERQGAFHQRSAGLAGLLAQQAALALRNAALREAAEARAERLRTLHHVALEATSALDLEALLEQITANASRLLATDAAYLRLWDEAAGGLRLHCGQGDPAIVAQLRPLYQPGSGTAGVAWQDGRAVNVADYQTWPSRDPGLAAAGLRVSAGVVLSVQDRRLGTLVVSRLRPLPFSAEDVELLGLFAQQAAQAIERARLLAEAETTLAHLAASEAQLVRSERLRAIAELTGGIAHNVNNLLSIILGHAELLRVALRDGALMPSTLDDRLAIISRAVEDGATMVRRLNEFTRTTPSREQVAVDLVALVRDVVALTRPRWEAGDAIGDAFIDVVLDLAAVPPVRGTPAELQEALVNLVLNAGDAMPRGGRLTLTTRQVGDAVEVSVSDTGVGMRPEVQARVFEPFFSTKGLVGTGLGLAVTHSIIRRHRGEIRVESAPGRGSCFTIALPAATAESLAAQPPPPPPSPRRLRLVVVDDDPMVLNFLRQFLELERYEVRSFTSPAAALASIAAERPDAVLSDIAMPGMNGWELARQIKGQAPVILVTGWGDTVDSAKLAAYGVVEVVCKPFRLEELRTALARLAPQW